MRDRSAGARAIVVALVFVLSMSGVTAAVIIGSTAVTSASGIDCGTPEEPTYSWMPELDPEEIKNDKAIRRQRRACWAALADSAFWPPVLLLAAFGASSAAIGGLVALSPRREDDAAPDDAAPDDAAPDDAAPRPRAETR